MPTGVITNINQKYVILNDKRHIVFTPILKFLLPNDTVEYTINNENKLVIKRLLHRKPHYLPAIVSNTDNEFAYLYSFLLPKYFSPYVDKLNLSKNDMVILFCTIDGISIHKNYTNNRSKDKDLFRDLFYLNMNLDLSPCYQPTSTPFYTKPFTDLSHLDSFNVDPPQSTDFDDAISVDLENRKIYVHIVDGNRIFENDPCKENEAMRKSYTLYLPDHIENMTENYTLFSLNQGEKRHVITIEYDVDNIEKYDIYPSTIVIKKRYDYESFSKDSSYDYLLSFTEKYNQKHKRNNLSLPSLYISLDDRGIIVNHSHYFSNSPSHKIIETMMILTNITISNHLKDALPQRFHSKSLIEKEEEDKEYKEDKEDKEYKEDKEDKEEEKEMKNIVRDILKIKKYRNAMYSETKKGHAGLNVLSYTHFTSPLRRYFDVIIHKALAGYTLINRDEILDYINHRERQIDIYTRHYHQLKLLDYFERNIGEIYEGYVINKTDKGLVIFLPDFLYEVFIFANETNETTKRKIKIKQVQWESFSIKASLI